MDVVDFECRPLRVGACCGRFTDTGSRRSLAVRPIHSLAAQLIATFLLGSSQSAPTLAAVAPKPVVVRRLIVIALLSSAVAYGAPVESHAGNWVLSDDCALACFRQILTHAPLPMETAAFLVNEDDGVACVIWPRTAWVRSQNFRGTIPPGTVAIVHTHAPYQEKPSLTDIRDAARLALPIFVVTRASIWIVDPSEDPHVTAVALGDWSGRLPTLVQAGCKRPRIAR